MSERNTKETEETIGYHACNYTQGDQLAEVRHGPNRGDDSAAAVRDARERGYDGVRWVHTDGYLYVDPPRGPIMTTKTTTPATAVCAHCGRTKPDHYDEAGGWKYRHPWKDA